MICEQYYQFSIYTQLLVLLTKTFITADKEILASSSTDYTICKLNQYQALARYCFWQ